jgi:hypothetical protein
MPIASRLKPDFSWQPSTGYNKQLLIEYCLEVNSKMDF